MSELAKALAFAQMKYRTIVADPPWPYPEGFVGGGGRQPNKDYGLEQRPLPYPSMSVEEISSLRVGALAERNCHLFLWTTNRYLRDAFVVMEAWGFRYRQTLVWHKPDVNLPGAIAPNSAEFILYGRIGRPERWGTFPTAVFSVARRGGFHTKSHSQKPDCLADYIETVCGDGPYLELFARRQRLGWDTWGNEALEHVEMEATA